MSNFLEWLMQGARLAYLSSTLIIISFVLYILGRAIYKQRLISKGVLFTSNQFSTRNIAYMGIMIACSVSVTVVISLTVPVTVFPPIRIAFEGIMIKITGMIFGPVIGLIVGLVTELLTMLFIPSFIHPAYFFVACGFGFWAGMCSFAFKIKNVKQWITLLIITIFIIVSTLFLYQTLGKLEVVDGTVDKVSLFGFLIPKRFVPFIFLVMMFAILVVIYITFFALFFSKKRRFLKVVMPIILICIVTEVLVTIIIASWGDADLLAAESDTGYINMVALRVVQVPVKIIFNTSLLSTVYFVLRPLIKNK